MVRSARRFVCDDAHAQVAEEIDGIETEKVKVKKANAALHKQIEESGMPQVCPIALAAANAYVKFTSSNMHAILYTRLSTPRHVP